MISACLILWLKRLKQLSYIFRIETRKHNVFKGIYIHIMCTPSLKPFYIPWEQPYHFSNWKIAQGLMIAAWTSNINSFHMLFFGIFPRGQQENLDIWVISCLFCLIIYFFPTKYNLCFSSSNRPGHEGRIIDKKKLLCFHL